MALLVPIFSDTSYFNQIFALLYADDTVILSESLEGMQKAFDNFQEYCN
jgi:hypothetical protein